MCLVNQTWRWTLINTACAASRRVFILGSDDHQKGTLAITEVLAAFAGPAGHFKELAVSGMGQAAWDVEEEERPG